MGTGAEVGSLSDDQKSRCCRRLGRCSVRIWLSWSSGKDSAWALHLLRREGKHQIEGLLTTLNEHHERVAMHGVRRSLLRAQARATGVPLIEVPLPWPCSNQQYEARMSKACDQAVAEGIQGIAFGDLFLEDVKSYRERQLAGTNLTPLFPLWGRDTTRLADQMMGSGLLSHITCVDSRHLDRSFAGRTFDRELLKDLPDGVDPCGENGEFHTFVAAGPMLSSAISVRVASVVERDGFVFADLI